MYVTSGALCKVTSSQIALPTATTLARRVQHRREQQGVEFRAQAAMNAAASRGGRSPPLLRMIEFPPVPEPYTLLLPQTAAPKQLMSAPAKSFVRKGTSALDVALGAHLAQPALSAVTYVFATWESRTSLIGRLAES